MNTTTPPRHWWLPKLRHAIWIAFFATLLLTNWREVLISADGDPSLHWRIGNWMIEHRAVLRADQFSHTRFAAPLVSKEWLAEVLFAAAGNITGNLANWNGTVLLAALLIATTMWLLHRWLVAEGCELLLATGLLLVAASACSMHWLARPHLTTHLLTIVFAWQLRRFEHGDIPVKTLYATLVPLMWLWTNLHGAFFTGFVLIGLYWLAAVWEVGRDRRARRGPESDGRPGGPSLPTTRLQHLTLLGLACLAVSFINPNTWHLHAQVIGFLRTPLLSKMTNEFRSPDFHSSSATGFLLLLGILAIVLLAARPKMRASELLLLGAWGYFALHSVRNLPIFALVATPILAGHLNPWLQSLPAAIYRRYSERITGLDRGADGRLPVALAAVTLTLLMTVPAKPVVTTAILPDQFPVTAVTWLKANPQAVTGEMFNEYGWGGYLMLYLPERKVFVDGRNDFYGGPFIEEFEQVDNVTTNWSAVLTKYKVGWTILPRRHALNQLLALDTGWSLVYTDAVTAIHSRR